jgi:hypothetical protein
VPPNGTPFWEELEVTKLLRLSNEVLPINEAVTRMAMNPLWLADEPDKRDQAQLNVRQWDMLNAVLRTGGIFVFQREDIPPLEVEPIEVLPPLPFTRVWLEIANANPGELQFVDNDGRMSWTRGFAIIEEEPGERWHIVTPLLDRQGLIELLDAGVAPEKAFMYATTLKDYPLKRYEEHGMIAAAVGRPGIDFDLGDERLNQRMVLMALLPEMLIQVLHTLGVVTEPTQLPRPRRREFRNRYGYEHPVPYRVHVRSVPEPKQGKGDREYHHRWLVRGHYRKHERGTHFVRGKGVCTWVRPYVKGPNGAPWKGRPIYTTAEANA